MAMPTAWAGLIAGTAVAAHDGPVLGDIARFVVDFRDQYYGLVGAVGDDLDGPPLITSGLIEPGECVWGRRPVRFAKQRYAAPRVALDRLSPAMQRWAGERLVPKILIANQTRVIEAVHDVRGEWLPGVPSSPASPTSPSAYSPCSPHRPRSSGCVITPRAAACPPTPCASAPASSRPSPSPRPSARGGRGGGASGGG